MAVATDEKFVAALLAATIPDPTPRLPELDLDDLFLVDCDEDAA